MDEDTKQAITDAVKTAMNGINKRLDGIEADVRAIRTEGSASASVTRAIAKNLLAPEELADLNIPD